MSRRYTPEKREIPGDLRYNSLEVQRFIHQLMRSGKKSTATRVLYGAFDLMEQRAKRPAIELFEQAIQNVMPQIEVKPRRVGGATYQVPVEVPGHRRLSLAMRWVMVAASKRGGKSMAERLAGELMDAANGQGAAVKRRDDTHRMAEANRAFAHFRF
jgi:small subunit ribosomal protein S7